MVTPTPTTVQVKIQLRSDTSANWASVNPVLLAGEMGLETNTNRIKIGNGSTAWNSLGYFPFAVSGGTVTGNLEIGTTGTLTFEGSSADNFETTLGVINPTADRTINLPNVSGTIITTGDTGTVTSTMIADGTIVNADVSASAAIAHSKLANITAGYVLIGNASNVPTATQVTGDVTISDTGVTAISSGVIVDADVSATAEIAVSKLANGTANQVIVTDGTNVSWSDDLTLAGNLTVNGTTTTINTQDLLVEDKNIIIGNVTTPDDTTANAGGITLKGATDKTINWYDATDAWTSSERFSVPLGSAASPSLTFTGDEDTGIYSPGADQLALSTNGVGRVFVDALGATKLQVDQQGAYPDTLLLRNQATNIGAGFNNTGNTISFLGNNASQRVAGIEGYRTTNNHGTLGIYAFANTGNAAASIRLGTSAGPTTDYNGYIVFGTGNNTSTERLRITSAGLVGIGTSAPSSLLSVYSGSNDNGVLVQRGSTTVDDYAQIGFAVTTAATPTQNAWIRAVRKGTGSDALAFGTDNTTRLYITPTGGFVGIGDNGPDSTLTVKAATGVTPFKVSGPSSEFAKIDTSGRLLVGTSSSTSTDLLVVEGKTDANTGPGFMMLRRGASNPTGGAALGQINFADASDSVGAFIEAEVDSAWASGNYPGRLVFATTLDGAPSPTERMRLNSSGQLLLGTTSAVNNAELQVANSFSVGGITKREVSKALTLADNVASTLFTFQIPGGSSQSQHVFVGGEISYIATCRRETSIRNARTTYGKIYFSIDRFWESNANNPVSINLVDTDKALSTSNGAAPTITWAISTDAGIDNAAKNVYIAVTVDNPFAATNVTSIRGTVSYHTGFTGTDVTLT